MKQKPLHYYLPYWTQKQLSKEKCIKCGFSKITKECAIAIGLREKDGTQCLFLEFKCPKCEYRQISIPKHDKTITIEKLCYLLLEEMQNKRRIAYAKSVEKSKLTSRMTDREIKAFIKRFRAMSSHDDFLKEIRANPLPNRKRKNAD